MQGISLIQAICGIFGALDDSTSLTDLLNNIDQKLKIKFVDSGDDKTMSK